MKGNLRPGEPRGGVPRKKRGVPVTLYAVACWLVSPSRRGVSVRVYRSKAGVEGAAKEPGKRVGYVTTVKGDGYRVAAYLSVACPWRFGPAAARIALDALGRRAGVGAPGALRWAEGLPRRELAVFALAGPVAEGAGAKIFAMLRGPLEATLARAWSDRNALRPPTVYKSLPIGPDG